MASNQNGELVKIRIGGLWEREMKGGGSFFAGRLNQGAQLLAFPNGYKKSPQDPDLILYLAPAQPARERVGSGTHDDAGGAHGPGEQQ